MLTNFNDPTLNEPDEAFWADQSKKVSFNSGIFSAYLITENDRPEFFQESLPDPPQ